MRRAEVMKLAKATIGAYSLIAARLAAGGPVAVDGEMLKAFEDYARALTAIACNANRAPNDRESKPGRKQIYDRAWATEALRAIASRQSNGLPDNQTTMVDLLRDRFEAAGKGIPGDSWLKKNVSEFYAWSRMRKQKMQKEFQDDAALREAFVSSEQFLLFSRMRDRIEEEWHSSKDLQRRFERPSDYLVHKIGLDDRSGGKVAGRS